MFSFSGTEISLKKKKRKSVRKTNLGRISFLIIQTLEDEINTLCRQAGNQLPTNEAPYTTLRETSATPMPKSKNFPRVHSLFLRPVLLWLVMSHRNLISVASVVLYCCLFISQHSEAINKVSANTVSPNFEKDFTPVFV
jgi:hypothetical protein